MSAEPSRYGVTEGAAETGLGVTLWLGAWVLVKPSVFDENGGETGLDTASDVFGLPGLGVSCRGFVVEKWNSRKIPMTASRINPRTHLFIGTDYINPRLVLAKRPKLGNTVERLLLSTPNHVARVAKY